MLYPFQFQPIFKERVWGGRKLEKLYQKPLPPDRPIGESWEISDRGDDTSVLLNGPLAGKTLRWLMEHHGKELLGTSFVPGAPFPLLVKILDASDRLSLQVHPSPSAATELGGEAKSEFWYLVATEPNAELYVGLKQGVTRAEFERSITSKKVERCFHTIKSKVGDAIFLPSGRVHGIGPGNVIFEIQQNSDTTYRVFDWNRLGLDGKPRDLHVRESLASIDFEDFEPDVIAPDKVGSSGIRFQYLLDHALFQIHTTQIKRGQHFHIQSHGAQVLGVISGTLELKAAGETLALKPGDFVLVPASVQKLTFQTHARTELLAVQF
jgi:mannose-6-phosphate isomerase